MASLRDAPKPKQDELNDRHQVALLTIVRLLAAFTASIYLANVSRTLRTLLFVPMIAFAVLLIAVSLDKQRELVANWLQQRSDPAKRKGVFWLAVHNLPYLALIGAAILIMCLCASRPIHELIAGFVIGIAASPICWWFMAQDKIENAAKS